MGRGKQRRLQKEVLQNVRREVVTRGLESLFVSGGPQKRLREEVSRQRRSWKEAGKEVATGGLKRGRNEKEALENKVARGGPEKRPLQKSWEEVRKGSRKR